MPGYGYSTPYSGMAGGPLPPGYLEAATLPGKYLAKGIADFGTGIGAALTKYQQDKKERDFAQTGMEAALAPFLDPHLSGPATADGVEPYAQRAAEVIGVENAKKLGKKGANLSTADMLAIKHSLETHQDNQLKAQGLALGALKLSDAQRDAEHEKKVAEALKTLSPYKDKVDFNKGAFDEAKALYDTNVKAGATDATPPDPDTYITRKTVSKTGEERQAEMGRILRDIGVVNPAIANSAMAAATAGIRDPVTVENHNGVAVVSQGGKVLHAFQMKPGRELKELSDADIKKFDAIKQGHDALNELSAMSKNETSGPLVGLFRSKNPWDIKAARWQKEIEGAVPGLARGVFGEVGVLTDADMERYKGQFPNVKTPKELIPILIKDLRRKLIKAHSSYVDTLYKSNRDVSGHIGDVQAGPEDATDPTAPPTVEAYDPTTKKWK